MTKEPEIRPDEIEDRLDPEDPAIVDINAWAAEGDDLPGDLQKVHKQHIQKLKALAASLRAAGVKRDLVHLTVRELIQAYEAELVQILAAYAEDDDR